MHFLQEKRMRKKKQRIALIGAKRIHSCRRLVKKDYNHSRDYTLHPYSTAPLSTMRCIVRGMTFPPGMVNSLSDQKHPLTLVQVPSQELKEPPITIE